MFTSWYANLPFFSHKPTRWSCSHVFNTDSYPHNADCHVILGAFRCNSLEGSLGLMGSGEVPKGLYTGMKEIYKKRNIKPLNAEDCVKDVCLIQQPAETSLAEITITNFIYNNISLPQGCGGILTHCSFQHGFTSLSFVDSSLEVQPGHFNINHCNIFILLLFSHLLILYF